MFAARMEEDDLYALASYPSFYAFPLTKTFGVELQQKTFYYPKDGGAEMVDDVSQKSPPCGFPYSPSRTSSTSSCSGSSGVASSYISSSSSFWTAAEYFPQLAAMLGSTPFYLYDEARIRANCRRLLRAFKTAQTTISFPSATAADSVSVGCASASAAEAVSAAVAAITSSVLSVSAGVEPPHAAATETALPSSLSPSVFCPFSYSSSTLSLFKHFTNYFAVKATPTPAILKIIYDEGLGVDCSTLSELLLAEAVGFWGERIFFTSSCTSPEAYRKAYDLRAIINVDNPADLHLLRGYLGGCMPDILAFRYIPSGSDRAVAAALLAPSPSGVTGLATPAGPAAITRASTASAAGQTVTSAGAAARNFWQTKKCESLRSNPGIIGEWHESKFGMTRTQVLTAVEQAQRMGVHRIGLHSMTLSNALDVEEIVATAACSFLLARDVRDLVGVDVELINLGGGLGVPYKPGQAPLDLDTLAQKLQRCLLQILCYSSKHISSNDGLARCTLGSGCANVGHSTMSSSLVECNKSTTISSGRASSGKIKSKSFSSGLGLGSFARSSTATENTARKPQTLPRLVMENGRFITADAAVFVTRVTHLKQTYKNYIGVDACMANLMRPGLYGAYHHITVVPDPERREPYSPFVYPPFHYELPQGHAGPTSSGYPNVFHFSIPAAQLQNQTHFTPTHLPVAAAANLPPAAAAVRPRATLEQKDAADLLLVYDVVGGLCENNDKFAVDRLLPRVETGDLLLIHDVGAHGHAMGFNYNGRLRSMECLRRLDGSVDIIRRAEDFEDLFTTVCCPGMPASAELLRLARYYYYYSTKVSDRQGPPSGKTGVPESCGSHRKSLLRLIAARAMALLLRKSDDEDEDEELCLYRAHAIDCFCKIVFFSTGMIATAFLARLLLQLKANKK